MPAAMAPSTQASFPCNNWNLFYFSAILCLLYPDRIVRTAILAKSAVDTVIRVFDDYLLMFDDKYFLGTKLGTVSASLAPGGLYA